MVLDHRITRFPNRYIKMKRKKHNTRPWHLLCVALCGLITSLMAWRSWEAEKKVSGNLNHERICSRLLLWKCLPNQIDVYCEVVTGRLTWESSASPSLFIWQSRGSRDMNLLHNWSFLMVFSRFKDSYKHSNLLVNRITTWLKDVVFWDLNQSHRFRRSAGRSCRGWSRSPTFCTSSASWASTASPPSRRAARRVEDSE